MDDRSRQLKEDALKFDSGAGRYKRRVLWDNMKAKIIVGILAGAGLLTVVILILR